MTKKILLSLAFVAINTQNVFAQTFGCTVLDVEKVNDDGYLKKSGFIKNMSRFYVNTESGNIYGDEITNQRWDFKPPVVLNKGSNADNIKIFSEFGVLGDFLLLQINLASKSNRDRSYSFEGLFLSYIFSGKCSLLK